MNAQKSVHEFEILTIDGEKKSLSSFSGKKMLFVNTASECGFTSQYEELQKLHNEYGDKLVIIGFPANNFGGQEPGSNSDIKSFCKKNYGVTFLMSNKVSVKGKDIDPMFNWLNQQENESYQGDIMWNFEKYLIDEDGVLIKRFRSITKPNSSTITSLI
jgi:glutathione peroxidase|tara:strand:+ start:123 stop:599 length:477 start_codon:yes stop_codon:yes gene_type:complete